MPPLVHVNGVSDWKGSEYLCLWFSSHLFAAAKYEKREPSTAFLAGGDFAIGSSGKFQPLMRYPIVYITELHLIFFRRQVASGGSWGYFCYTEGAVIQISASYMQFWIKTTKSNQDHLRICILFDTEWWQIVNFPAELKQPVTWPFFEDNYPMNCKLSWEQRLEAVTTC